MFERVFYFIQGLILFHVVLTVAQVAVGGASPPLIAVFEPRLGAIPDLFTINYEFLAGEVRWIFLMLWVILGLLVVTLPESRRSRRRNQRRLL